MKNNGKVRDVRSLALFNQGFGRSCPGNLKVDYCDKMCSYLQNYEILNEMLNVFSTFDLFTFYQTSSSIITNDINKLKSGWKGVLEVLVLLSGLLRQKPLFEL